MNMRSRPSCVAPALAAAALFLVSAGCFNLNSPSQGDLGAQGHGDVRLELVEWGRLVDVADETGVVVQSNVLIREDVQPDGVNYNLAINPVTEEETLTVLEPAGTPAFSALLTAAQAGVQNVNTKGPSDAPPYPYIPRNAAIRLTFTELVNPATVNATTIQVWTGNPPSQAQSVRYLVQNDTKSGKGRVLLDPTISARQSSTLGLPQNSLGFPASFDTVNDNVMVRIPTEVNVAFGQPQVLRNLSNTRSFKPSPADPIVNNLAGDPVVVRSLRSGNDNDLNRGFLKDAVRPSLVTVQDVTVSQIAAGPVANTVDITYSVDAVNCKGLVPKPGDTFEIGVAVAVVTSVLNSSNTSALQVRANVLEGVLTPSSSSQSGRLTTRYTAQDALRQACYLQFMPQPVVSVGTPIVLNPLSSVTVRFDEPLDPTTVLSMNSLVTVAYEATATDNTAPYQKNGPESVGTYIDRQRGFHNPRPGQGTPEYGGRILFGPVEVANGSRDFTLIPMSGFTNPDAVSGDQFYALALRDGAAGITDLAGNPLAFTGFVAGTPLAGVPAEQTMKTSNAPTDKYLSLRGLGIDEDGDGLSEYSGQFDVAPGQITGRSPDHLSLTADSNTESIGRGLTLNGTQNPVEPLNPAGAVVQGVFREHDLGLSYFNSREEYNLDVAGMAWSPQGGVVNDDTFDRFRIGLAHANQMPDEVPNPFNPTQPLYPNSGLFFGGAFDDNILGFPTYNEKVVSDGEYTLRAISLFVSATGTTMLPFPEFTTTYTWRDTSIPQSFVGASGGIGSPPSLVAGAGFWGAENVPSVGLPLLVRWSTFPRGNLLGVNKFQASNMFPTGYPTFLVPAFRVFSSGGEDAGGRYNPVIPDNSAFGGTRPTGGFMNGQPTPNHDQNVYWAQVDFVLRVSRVFTHWFDLGTTLTSAGDAVGVLVEPDVVNQSPGTQVVVEMRGSAAVQEDNTGPKPSPLRDADIQFDDYGDFLALPNNSSSVSTPGPFTTDPHQLEAQPQPYRFLQLRLSFISNTDQDLQAYMDGLGFAWKF